jgi:Tfp pilus assembly protein PilF
VPTLDDELDVLDSMRRAGRREEAREALRQRTSRSTVAAERFTLLMTLARWTSEEGDPLAAAGLLSDIDGRGVPPELLKAAWRLAAVNWRKAGRPEEADRVDLRLRERFPDAAARESGSGPEATP